MAKAWLLNGWFVVCPVESSNVQSTMSLYQLRNQIFLSKSPRDSILLLSVHSHDKHSFPLPLIQEEQVVSYWQKNGHLILVYCLREACPGTVWISN